MRALSAMCLLGLLGLIACGHGTEDTATTSTVTYAPEISLGTGEIEFEHVDDGGSVYLVYGPQGGYHLLGSVRTRGIDAGDPTDLSAPNNPTLTFSVVWNEAEMVMSAPITQGMDAMTDTDAEWTHEMVGRFAILDITTDADIAGQTVLFGVSVEDSDGIVYTDTKSVVVEPHPSNSPG